MKSLFLLPVVGGVLLLSGCTGARSEFGCNATSTDSCMTMEQANEKAKSLEEGSAAKPAAAVLPRLADGNFAAVGRDTGPVPGRSVTTTARMLPRSAVAAAPVTAATAGASVSVVTTTSTCTLPRCAGVGSTRPDRRPEQTAQLWIAPWIDRQDVYHQPGKVLFVVKPAVWGQPRAVY